jgi:hypothetical protein
LSNIVLGFLSKPSRLSGYEPAMASGFTLAGFTLQSLVQRKMELNDHCSPGLLNVRRQKNLTVDVQH